MNPLLRWREKPKEDRTHWTSEQWLVESAYLRGKAEAYAQASAMFAVLAIMGVVLAVVAK